MMNQLVGKACPADAESACFAELCTVKEEVRRRIFGQCFIEFAASSEHKQKNSLLNYEFSSMCLLDWIVHRPI